jgi:hypothetical protein
MSPQIHGNRRRQASQRGSSFATSSIELVEEYPISSTVLAFGVGLGIGVLVGQTIAGALRSEPDPSSGLESLSQQVCDAVRKSVPEAISRHLPR